MTYLVVEARHAGVGGLAFLAQVIRPTTSLGISRYQLDAVNHMD